MNFYKKKNGEIVDENFEILVMDESNPKYQDYVAFLQNNEILPVDENFFDFKDWQDRKLINLTECCTYLTDRALISSISKEGDVEFLKGQAERYRNKYNVAKQYCINQTINNQAWYDAIVLEMSNTNTELGLNGTSNELTVISFMTLIRDAFESGLERSEKFEPNIEVFRCKTKDLIIAGQIERAESMLLYAWSLPIKMQLSDVDTFMSEIDAI